MENSEIKDFEGENQGKKVLEKVIKNILLRNKKTFLCILFNGIKLSFNIVQFWKIIYNNSWRPCDNSLLFPSFLSPFDLSLSNNPLREFFI